MALEETPVLIDDLKLIRNALGANLVFHQSTDLANAQCNMSKPRYRPITVSTDEALQRVNGILGDYLLATHLEEPETVAEGPEEQAEGEAEQEDELDPNPLGQVKFHTQTRRKMLAGQRLGLYDDEAGDKIAGEEPAAEGAEEASQE